MLFPSGFSLMVNSPNIRKLEISEKGYVWKDFFVKEQGELEQQRRLFFLGKRKNYHLTRSKIIRTNCDDKYIMGGINNYPSILFAEYDVPRSCLRLNLKSGVLERMQK